MDPTTDPNQVDKEAPQSTGQPKNPLKGVGGDGAPANRNEERRLWTGRTHWKHYSGRVAAVAVVLIIVCVGLGLIASRTSLSTGTAFWIGLVAVLVACGATSAWLLVRILSRRYELSSQRLFIDRGLLSITRDQTELIRVDDVRVRKTLVDRVFGLGTIEILSTDASDRTVTIDGVKDPDMIAEHIRTHMRALRSRSLFVENL